MPRQSVRLRVGVDGRLEVVDPGIESLDLLRAIDPDFCIREARLTAFRQPRCLQLHQLGGGLEEKALAELPEKTLWEFHNQAMHRVARESESSPGEASLLALKRILAERMLAPCCLCGYRCAVDRHHGVAGRCGLDARGRVAEHFVHIGEEAPINPSLVVSLAGCGLRCRYCQQWPLLKPMRVESQTLDGRIWSQLDTQGARSLSFVGGNPDESLPSILRFLEQMPHDWSLPIVWNSHAYASPQTLQLLDGVVDVYIPDFKYGDEGCGQRLSAAPNYPQVAREAISAMLGQSVPVLVRILVLPGHVECCHLPTLDTLAKLQAPGLQVSIRDQYAPDWRISERDGELTRRPSVNEVARVREHAKTLRLTVLA